MALGSRILPLKRGSPDRRARAAWSLAPSAHPEVPGERCDAGTRVRHQPRVRQVSFHGAKRSMLMSRSAHPRGKLTVHTNPAYARDIRRG